MGELLQANRDRLQRGIDELAAIGKTGPTAMTRLAFTADDNAAHDHIEAKMRELGLETRYDAFGNLFGRLPGRDADALPVLTGSHLDGPPDGGIYDGVIGVLAGLEICAMLQENQVRPRRPIEVVAVRSEHLDRFGISCLGSRALGGKLTEEHLDRLRDEEGVSLRQALTESGFAPDELASACVRNRIHAWVELHVEQGRVLEDQGRRIGVITAIAAPTRYRVGVKGMADHSGATPMSLRKDALMGAAEMALDLERLARATEDCVGTIGILKTFPGAVHTIPGLVEFYVDIRGVRAEAKRALVEAYRRLLDKHAAARRPETEVETFVDEDPVPCADRIVQTLQAVCDENTAEYMLMPSGAGHDTQHVAAAADVGMMFIPSAGGIAHTPDEFTEIEDVAYGAEILGGALVRLANE